VDADADAAPPRGRAPREASVSTARPRAGAPGRARGLSPGAGGGGLSPGPGGGGLSPGPGQAPGAGREDSARGLDPRATDQ